MSKLTTTHVINVIREKQANLTEQDLVLSEPKMALDCSPFIVTGVEKGAPVIECCKGIEFNPALFFKTHNDLQAELYKKTTLNNLFKALESLPKATLLNFIRPLGLEAKLKPYMVEHEQNYSFDELKNNGNFEEKKLVDLLGLGVGSHNSVFFDGFTVMFAIAENFEANYYANFNLSLQEGQWFDLSMEIVQVLNVQNRLFAQSAHTQLYIQEINDGGLLNLPKSLVKAEKAFAMSEPPRLYNEVDLEEFEYKLGEILGRNFNFSDM